MNLSLLILDPDGRAKQWPLREGTLRVGRGKANDLIIVGRGVSRNHATLQVDDDTVEIKDQDSTYGTKVNGRQVRSATLSVGDHVDVGVFRLILVPGSEAIEETGGQSRARKQDGTISEPTGEGYGRFDEVTTGVLSRSDSDINGVTDPHRVAEVSAPVEAHIPGLSPGVPLNVRFVRGGLAPALQAMDVDGDLQASLPQMVARVEQMAQALASGTGGPKADSSDLASLLLVYRAAELMSEVADLATYLDQVLDLLVSRLGISTAVLVRRTEIGQLRAVSVRHQDPLKAGEIPVSRAVVDKALETGQPVYSKDLRTDPSFGHRDSVMAYQVGALLAVPLVLSGQAVGVLYLSRAAGSSFDRTETETVLGICALLAKALSLREIEAEALELKKRNEVLERFHAPEVLERLFEPRDSLLGTQRLKATALYVEIEGFEMLIEELERSALQDLVVGLRSVIYEAVFGNGGTTVWLRECSGLAVFGGQSTAESDAAWALSASMEILREFASLAAQLELPSDAGIRIGLDRGPLSVGVLGPNDRLLYAALGAPVLRAQRLSRLGDVGAIHASERALQQVPNPRGTVERLDPDDTMVGGHLYRITL